MTRRRKGQSPAGPGAEIYAWLDRELNEGAGMDIGFEALVPVGPVRLDPSSVEGFQSRYRTIKAFQDAVMRTLRASLEGRTDPAVAALLLGDSPSDYREPYHRDLADAHLTTPMFFRTDEPSPGQLSEIQCCGSAWDLAEALWLAAEAHPRDLGGTEHFPESPASAVARAMRATLGADPVVHHLLDNASRPHGMRYFVQRTRRHGVRYFGYDRDVASDDCRLVRSHDFVSLAHHNFFGERMEGCRHGRVRFDLPPTPAFDSKLILAWPFWSRTREGFDDSARRLFPFTAVIDPDEVEMEDGRPERIEDLFRRPQSQRRYFVKYAGTDVGLNWGSKAVYLASTLSRPQGDLLAARIREDWARNRPWVLQTAVREKAEIRFWSRDGAETEVAANSKWSGFYGPLGLLSILGFHRPSHKVHGSVDTVLSVIR